MSTAHPGNPCLAAEYNSSPGAAFYINTGYDSSYTDSSHTTTDCSNQSATISGDVAHKAAWAVGCSEAEGDINYTFAQGVPSPSGWWLDVEIANSWCGQHGVSCDLSLNQFAIQGIIDELTHVGAMPIGIYSNQSMWTAIVGSNTVQGQSADWYALGQPSAGAAKAYCTSSYRFTGDPVQLVQFPSGYLDYDYAC